MPPSRSRLQGEEGVRWREVNRDEVRRRVVRMGEKVHGGVDGVRRE